MEKCWEYPRPPRLEVCNLHVRVVCDGRDIVDTQGGIIRILEKFHPPGIYLPWSCLEEEVTYTDGITSCEYKGLAQYFLLPLAGRGWYYATPRPPYERLCGYFSLYPATVDACFINEQPVRAQEGNFYGGWITDDIIGPFKGSGMTPDERPGMVKVSRGAW